MKLLFLIVFLLFRVAYASEPSVVINEIMPHPSSGEDWVELYNPTTQTIDLTNWIISDSSSVIKTLSGSLAPANFIVINLTNRLNNGGDSVILKDSSQQIIDQYTYTSDPGIDISISRIPDGGTWEGPLPSPSPSISPSPSSSPSSSPSPSASTAVPEMTLSLSQNSFSQDQELSAAVSLTNFPAQTSYYLKGAFFKDDSTNYFGKTLINAVWVRNLQTYSSQLPVTTDNNGSWQGTIKLMIDLDDSGYSGPGDYQLKIARYSDSGSGPSWSINQSVTILAATPTSSSSPTPSPSAPSIQTSINKPTSKSTAILPAAILGAEGTGSSSLEQSTSPAILEEINPTIPSDEYDALLFWAGIGSMVSGAGLLLFLSFKHPTIASWYGKQITQIRQNQLLQNWLSKLWTILQTKQ